LKTTFLASCIVILLLAETGAVCAQARPQTDGQNTGQVSFATSDPFVGTSAGEERDDNGLKLKLVWCPSGTFTMGSPKSEKGREDKEDQVQVTLTRGFWIGKYEVTQDEWARVMGTAPWKDQAYVHERPQSPACYITWDDAREFVRKFTEQERRGGRLPEGWEYTLPTEAQWEYACRAGTKTAFSFGDAEALLSDYAWWGGLFGNGNAGKEQYAHEVGGKKPNAWGLHDLHGNVWEWCADGMDPYDNKLTGGRDPFIAEGLWRVNRGGGWYYEPAECRSARRGCDAPEYCNSNLGFRLARSPVR
jgi:formylglycine-generating enzyme required for sulfatase activity